MKSWLFPIFFLIFLFSDQLLSVSLSLMGMTVQSGMLQRIFIPIALVSYAILLRDIMRLRNPKIQKILVITVLFMVFYILSSFTHSPVPYEYSTRLLRFLSICIAGVAIGIHLSTYPCFDKIEKLLPFFVILFVVILGRYGFEASMNNMIIKEEEGEGIGLNYQSFSYYMAIEYTYCAYFLLFSTIRGTRFHRLMTIPMTITCIVAAALCIMGGGRGPFLYLGVITLVLLYFYGRTHKLLSRQIWIIPLLMVGFTVIVSKFHVFDSIGFIRISENLTEDTTRPLLYARAWEAFLESPIIGHGFGSIWWTVGWACHNMILDLLAEGGIIGAGFVLYYFFFTGKYLWKRTRINSCIILILIVFIESMVENFFSGYWVSCQAVWFSLAFAITDSRRFITVR